MVLDLDEGNCEDIFKNKNTNFLISNSHIMH